MFQSQRLKLFFCPENGGGGDSRRRTFEKYIVQQEGVLLRVRIAAKSATRVPRCSVKKKKKLVKNVHKKWFDCQLTFPVAPLFFCCNFRAKRTDIFCWPCQCWPSCYEEEPVVVAGTRFMEWQHQQQQAPSWKIFYKYIAQHRAGRRKFQTCLLSRRRAAQKNCSSKVWKISSTSLRRLFAYQMNRMAAS